MERFSCKTRIVAGTGALETLKDLGCKRVLVVADPYFMENGTAQRVAALTGAAKTALFSKVQPDPSVTLAAEGTALVQQLQPDTVIALGGGSAMDCAKAMVYFAGGRISLVAIPTTSGSGSEVTDFAILTHDNTKHPLIDESMRPDVAIMDSALLTQLPPKLVADTGFDVICHALEAYVATDAGAITDALARDAFATAYAALPASFGGDRSVRQSIHTAATMAGMAFTQAGLGLCHAMAHSLGGLFHVPHGRLNAILLPEVVRWNATAAGKKYASLARGAGFGGSADTVAVRNLQNALLRLRKTLQLPDTLQQAGIAPQQVQAQTDRIVAAAVADPCCRTNPLPVDGALVRRVLSQVMGHV